VYMHVCMCVWKRKRVYVYVNVWEYVLCVWMYVSVCEGKDLGTNWETYIYREKHTHTERERHAQW